MKKILFMAVLIFSGGAAFAETLPTTSQPVEISAAKSLEWNRKARTYTAHENVIVTQGAVKIQSDSLTASYNDENGMTDISTLEAASHVVISSPPYTAYGDRAVYNVKTGSAVLTGKNLKIKTDTDVLTAQDRIDFSVNENKLTAHGNATAVHGDDIITADALSAYFVKDAHGRMVADKVTGQGHVTIKTAKETATGDNGIYNVATQKAVLTGRVRILQDKNWLEGTRADVDMVTGISRLSSEGNAATDGRVKGVFYPKQKPEDQKK